VAEKVVANPTKQAPDIAGGMIVINRELTSAPSSSLTDVARASLRLVERLILLRGDSIRSLDPSGVRRLSKRLLAGPMTRCAAGTGRLKCPTRTPAILA